MSKLSPPIFLVGCPRSGTTLLASYLGRHPELLALPETQYFAGSYSGPFWVRKTARKNPKDLFNFVWERNIRLQDVALDVDALRMDFETQNLSNLADAFHLVLEHSLHGSGKHKVVEKSPRHIEYVKQLLNWFPEAPIICLVRDGRDTVNSLLEAPWTHNHSKRHISYWRWCVRRAQKLQARYPHRVQIVKFEDFVADPEPILRQICAWANMPFAEEMLDLSQGIRTVPDWERDWKTKATQAADLAGLNKWQAHPDQDKMNLWTEVMSLELKALGYLGNAEVTHARSPLNLDVPKMNIYYGLRYLYHTHLVYRANRFRRRQLEAARSS